MSKWNSRKMEDWELGTGNWDRTEYPISNKEFPMSKWNSRKMEDGINGGLCSVTTGI